MNLTALDDAARACGLRPLGVTTQDRFLIANGLLEIFESSEVETWRDPARVRARLQAMQLIHPHGMGRSFKVAIYAKAVDSLMPLSGLRDPFAGA